MMAIKGRAMSLVLQQIIFCGLILFVISDELCDGHINDTKVVDTYADKVESSNMTVCFEYTHIDCGSNYATSLLEKRPTVYCNVEGKCEYLSILFFGKYEDSNSTSLLWFVYDIPAEDFKTGFTGQSGNEIVIYTKPKNSEAPADHVFFLYCQDDSLKNFECCNREERDDFDVKDFAKSKNFGNPVAGLSFRVTANGQLMNSTSYSKKSRRYCRGI